MTMKAISVFAAFLVAFFPESACPKHYVIRDESLTLQRCMEIAIENNPGLSVARDRIDIAKSTIRKSRSELFPQITGGYRYSGSGKPGDTYQTGGSAKLSLSQSIYNGGYNLSALSLSRNTLRITDEELRKIKNLLMLDIKTSFYEVMKSEKLLDVQRESVKLAHEQLRKAQGMFDAEKASRADLLKSMAQLSRSRIDSLNAERNYLMSRWQLAKTMGVWIDNQVGFSDNEAIYDCSDLTQDECLRIAIENNPEIRKTEAQMLASKIEIDMARSSKRPRISATADYYSDGDLLTGLTVTMPIFDGMMAKASIAESKAKLRISEKSLEETKQVVEISVRESYAETSFFKEAIRLMEEGVKAAEEDFKLAVERYELGMGTMLELMNAQVELINAKSERVEALYDYKLAIAKLESALGR